MAREVVVRAILETNNERMVECDAGTMLARNFQAYSIIGDVGNVREGW